VEWDYLQWTAACLPTFSLTEAEPGASTFPPIRKKVSASFGVRERYSSQWVI
jgi:hypothetical protein